MVEDLQGPTLEQVQRRQEIAKLRSNIEELLDENGDAVFMLIAPDWLPRTGMGLPQILTTYDDGELERQVNVAVVEKLIKPLELTNDDINRHQSWDDDGSVSVTEANLLKFLEGVYEYPDDMPTRELLESGGAYVIDGQLVWTVDNDPETERWWVNVQHIDGHKFRALYAGYLQGRLKSLEAQRT